MVPRVYLPIRAFQDAKQRLATSVGSAMRTALATAFARHTVEVVRAAGASPTVVSSSPEVATWAAQNGLTRLPDRGNEGLNGAAHQAISDAKDEAWVVLHTDLPLLAVEELGLFFNAISLDAVAIAPSYDGGTTAIGGYGSFDFSYGPASAHRHLAGSTVVISSLGFQLDVDHPGDLVAARNHPRGRWLEDILGSGPPAA